MKKITFKEFEAIMTQNLLTKMPKDYDVSKLESYQMGPCIEIEFRVDDDREFQECWMGKLIDKKTRQYVYWYGLTDDGTQAYDFETFESFTNAEIFCGNNIKEIWGLVSIISFNGGTTEEL